MPIFTGELWSHGGREGNLSEALENPDFFAEHAGEPVILRVSKGYKLFSPGFYGEADTHRAVSVEREYSFGILAAGDSSQEQSDRPTIPVQGFLSWQSKWDYFDPTTDVHGDVDLKIGMEWTDAVPEHSKKSRIVVPSISQPKKSTDVNTFGVRVPIKDRVLQLDIGPSSPNGNKTRFMVVEGALGSSLVHLVLNRAEREDTLLAKILEGSVEALKDATNPKMKQPAARAAKREAERIEQEIYAATPDGL